MAIPASLPLEDGQLTCLTCHDADPQHAAGGAPVGVRGGLEGQRLCFQCHDADSPSTRAIHAHATTRAHLTGERRGLSGGRIREGLDLESQTCLTCHDGAAGLDAGSHQFGVGGFGTESDHPIGVPMVATERTKHGDFRLVRVVDPRIRLLQGVVGCGSCHSVYSSRPAQLVMSNQGSKLCLSCHQQ